MSIKFGHSNNKSLLVSLRTSTIFFHSRLKYILSFKYKSYSYYENF